MGQIAGKIPIKAAKRKKGSEVEKHVSQDDDQQQAELRGAILNNPELVLEDPEIMRILTTTPAAGPANNIVDLRSVALDRMEMRLGRLEDTHRSVVAAAYENLAGMNQVHRAILRMLDPVTFESFLHNLGTDVAEILRVDCLRLVLESAQSEDDPVIQRLSDVLSVAEPGFAKAYMTGGRGSVRRPVILRQIHPDDALIFGNKAADMRSEAVLYLDLGDGRLPGMLVMGSEDPNKFHPSHGTDLLVFFASVFERTMRRWLT